MDNVKEHRAVDADAAAPAEARELVAEMLSGRDPSVVHAATLVVSELVSNAVLHGSSQGDPVEIDVDVDDDRIRIEVVDFGAGFDGARRRSGPGGFGLDIVERLAKAWGADDGPPHKVWVELTDP